MANLKSKSTAERGKKMSAGFMDREEEPKSEKSPYHSYEGEPTPVEKKSMLRKLLEKGKDLLKDPNFGKAKYNTEKGKELSGSIRKGK